MPTHKSIRPRRVLINAKVFLVVVLWSGLLAWHGYDFGVKTERAKQLRIATASIDYLKTQVVQQRQRAVKLNARLNEIKLPVKVRYVEVNSDCEHLGADWLREFNRSAVMSN